VSLCAAQSARRTIDRAGETRDAITNRIEGCIAGHVVFETAMRNVSSWIASMLLAGCTCAGQSDVFAEAAASSIGRAGDDLVWVAAMTHGNDVIGARPVDQSAPVRVVWQGGHVDAFASDGAHAAFAVAGSEGPSLIVLGPDGQTTSALPARASAISIDGEQLAMRSWRAVWVRRAGAWEQVAALPSGEVYGLASTPTRVVWLATDVDGCAICSVPLSGGETTCRDAGPGGPSSTIVARGETLWVSRGLEDEARIERFDPDHSHMRMPRPFGTSALAVDGDDAFWVESNAQSTWTNVMHATSGRADRIATEDDGRAVLYADRDGVWWTTSRGIRRLPR